MCQIRAGGDYVIVGELFEYLKMGWNRKEVRGNKYFKKEGQAGSRGWCLKKRATRTPLQTMASFLFLLFASLVSSTVIVLCTKIYTCLKSDLSIEVLNFMFLLAEYWPFDKSFTLIP